MSRQQDHYSTPQTSLQIPHSKLRDRLPSFSTTSGLSMAGSADSFSTSAADQADITSQQEQIHDTIKRLTRITKICPRSISQPRETEDTNSGADGCKHPDMIHLSCLSLVHCSETVMVLKKGFKQRSTLISKTEQKPR